MTILDLTLSIRKNIVAISNKTISINISSLISNLIITDTQADNAVEIIEHKIRMALENIVKTYSINQNEQY